MGPKRASLKNCSPHILCSWFCKTRDSLPMVSATMRSEHFPRFFSVICRWSKLHKVWAWKSAHAIALAYIGRIWLVWTMLLVLRFKCTGGDWTYSSKVKTHSAYFLDLKWREKQLEKCELLFDSSVSLNASKQLFLRGYLPSVTWKRRQ
jgi:hypothetical protein